MNGCPVPTRTDSFSRTDESAVVWFTFQNALAGNRVYVNWIRPDGNLYRTNYLPPIPSAGSWCMWAGLEVASNPPAGVPGVWQAWVFVDGVPATIIPFNIR